jgi:hypothetical protein
MTASLTDSTGRRWCQRDIDLLCRAAEIAWRTARPHARQARFLWRGRRWVVRHSAFRLLVDDAHGNPVCCQWG